MTAIVEKPTLEDAPSNLAVTSRYVLDKAIWPLLEQTLPGAGGEIQLTDAIAALMKNHMTDAYHIVGKSHDCGNKSGYMLANIEYGLRHKDTALALRQFIAEQAVLGAKAELKSA